MSETRRIGTESDPSIARRRYKYSYWTMTARINHAYAALHGYGFAYYEIQSAPANGTPAKMEPCPHTSWGSRAASWCKVPAVAMALLDGVEGRPCGGILLLDSDAHVDNISLSIDAYLARAKFRGDDALTDEREDTSDGTLAQWLLLFASDFWFAPSQPNCGVWLARGGADSAQSCGLLRRWWDSHWPSFAHGAEQTPLQHTYSRVFEIGGAWHDVWGGRVRLLPTARFFRRDDPQWWHNVSGSWDRLLARAPEMAPLYSEDDFIHHGVRAICCSSIQIWKSIRSKAPVGLPPPTVTRINGSELARIFERRAAECPVARPSLGTPRGFDNEQAYYYRRDRRHGLQRDPSIVYRNHSHTRLDGSKAPVPRRCWRDVYRGAFVHGAARTQAWNCGT